MRAMDFTGPPKKKKKVKKTLNPGSKEAVDKGCLCPILDNHHGKGLGNGMFWRNQKCPLHGG